MNRQRMFALTVASVLCAITTAVSTVAIVYCLYHIDQALLTIGNVGESTPAQDIFFSHSQVFLKVFGTLLGVSTLSGFVLCVIFGRQEKGSLARITQRNAIVETPKYVGPLVFYSMFGWFLCIIASIFAMTGKGSGGFDRPFEAKYSFAKNHHLKDVLDGLSSKLMTTQFTNTDRLLARNGVLVVSAQASCSDGLLSSLSLPRDIDFGKPLELNSWCSEYFYSEAERDNSALPRKEPEGLILVVDTMCKSGYVGLDVGTVPAYRHRLYFLAIDLRQNAIVGSTSRDGDAPEFSPSRGPGGRTVNISSVEGSKPNEREAIESLLERR